LKKSTVETSSMSELIASYEKTALEYGQAIDSGDHRTANKQNDRIRLLRKEMGRRGDDGLAAISHLMENPAAWVRLLAAGYVLRFAPQKAEPVLQQLSEGPEFFGFTAETILKQWKKDGQGHD
jgi:hypothetical protein